MVVVSKEEFQSQIEALLDRAFAGESLQIAHGDRFVTVSLGRICQDGIMRTPEELRSVAREMLEFRARAKITGGRGEQSWQDFIHEEY